MLSLAWLPVLHYNAANKYIAMRTKILGLPFILLLSAFVGAAILLSNKVRGQQTAGGAPHTSSQKKQVPQNAVTGKNQSTQFANYVKQLSETETQADNLYLANEDLKKDTKKKEQAQTQLDAQKLNLKESIAPLLQAKNGSDTFTFKGVSYYVFVADLDTYDIKLHWKDTKGKIYGNMGNLLHSGVFRDNPPAMITNGGMFNSDISPEGLLVENGNVKAPLNLSKPNNENFYLKPNGIFYIAKDGTAHIDTSYEGFDALTPKLDQATQSGPMLVINGKIHDKFARASTNKKIRSGVGLITDKKVVFVISQTEVNFYDFALLFNDIYNCQNALFLDGAISLMYLRDKLPNETGGHFCTLISAARKKHAK